MSLASPQSLGDPLIVIFNIDSPEGELRARAILAEDAAKNIRGLTTKEDLAALKEKWTAGDGVQLIELVHVERGDKAALQNAFAGASCIIIITDYAYYLQEQSSLSRASVSMKPVERIAAFREVAEGKDAIAAAATVRGLTKLVVSLVPAVASD
jgi:hypothetical protein